MASNEENRLSEEIEELRNMTVEGHGVDRLRLIEHQGEFRCSVSVSFSDVRLKFRFQLYQGLFTTCPEIVLTSEGNCIDAAELSQLTAHLRASVTCRSRASDSGVLPDLVRYAFSWLTEKGINVIGIPAAEKGATEFAEKRRSSKKKEKKKETSSSDEETREKSDRMRTATDVLQRIRWDALAPSEQFIIGYLDRFTGIQEQPFLAFSWENIASVDNTVLAIPRHRIQYFKYRGVKVWDKADRLDHVFGSTGSRVTLHEAIGAIDTELGLLQRYVGGRPTEHLSSPDSDDDGDDSDDDFRINLTAGRSSCAFQIAETDSESDDTEVKNYDIQNFVAENSQRPNYFVCVRIDSAVIRAKVEAVQTHIVRREPRYSSCALGLDALHVTLCTLRLDSAAEIDTARNILDRSRRELTSQFPEGSMELHFSGVGAFFQRVLFAKIAEDQALDKLKEFSELLRILLATEGLRMKDRFEFTPHMTLLKVSRPVQKLLRSRFINTEIYRDFLDTEFGKFSVDNLYLCSITQQRTADGFYHPATRYELYDH